MIGIFGGSGFWGSQEQETTAHEPSLGGQIE
jgi:hypothetical protein